MRQAGKRVLLVGHCSPDSSYLTIAVRAVCPDAILQRVNDDAALLAAMHKGADLLLINRVLDGDFADESGMDLIGRWRKTHPHIPMMLISNFAHAQAAALANGAVPGFGKSELHTNKPRELLATALGGPTL